MSSLTDALQRHRAMGMTVLAVALVVVFALSLSLGRYELDIGVHAVVSECDIYRGNL